MIIGRGFGTDCNDTGKPGPPLGEPERDIKVAFVQGRSRVVLGSVDARDDYGFETRLAIPAAAQIGPASISINGRSVHTHHAPPPSAPSAKPASSENPDTVGTRWGLGVSVTVVALLGGGALTARRWRRKL